RTPDLYPGECSMKQLRFLRVIRVLSGFVVADDDDSQCKGRVDMQNIKLILPIAETALLIMLFMSSLGCGGASQSTPTQPPTQPPPVPTISSISPSGVIAGSGDRPLTVNGTNFVSTSV